MSVKRLKGPFRIVEDNSCDYFLIPADKYYQWYNEYLCSDEYEDGNIPDYARYIEGFGSVDVYVKEEDL